MTANECELYIEIVQKGLLDLLSNREVSIGQKIFVLNIYIENLSEFGTLCLVNIRGDCLNIFLKLSSDFLTELKYTLSFDFFGLF